MDEWNPIDWEPTGMPFFDGIVFAMVLVGTSIALITVMYGIFNGLAFLVNLLFG